MYCSSMIILGQFLFLNLDKSCFVTVVRVPANVTTLEWFLQKVHPVRICYQYPSTLKESHISSTALVRIVRVSGGWSWVDSWPKIKVNQLSWEQRARECGYINPSSTMPEEILTGNLTFKSLKPCNLAECTKQWVWQLKSMDWMKAQTWPVPRNWCCLPVGLPDFFAMP